MYHPSRVAFAALLVASTSFAQSLVKDINTYTQNGNSVTATNAGLTAVNGGWAYFAANDGVNGSELWKTDGTAANTVLVKDINTSAAGASSTPAVLVAFNTGVLFSATDGVAGIELWYSDGTAAGTVMVKDINAAAAASTPTALKVMGGKCYFFAADATAGRELWVTDGTNAGTTLVKDIQAGATGSISTTATTPMVAVGATLYFPAVDVATTGTELWKSDGTSAGTVMVKDINPAASGSSSPLNLIPFNGKLLFNATDGATGVEPWVSDGTAAGTMLLLDCYPGTASSTPASSMGTGAAAFPYAASGPYYYFSAIDSTAGTGTGREMYVTDGTPAGTKLIVDLVPGIGNGATTIGFYAVGNRCTFQGTTSTFGTEGYITDGTAAGTVIFADCWAGPNSGFPAPFFLFGGKYYINAGNGSFGAGSNFEFMVTDGTPAGTKLVKEIGPGGFPGDANSFFAVNGKLCFFSNDGATGVELWTSDGTAAGTVLVKDINQVGLTTSSSSPGPMVKLGSKAYFAANDGSSGIELWSTDGTAGGTTLVKDICNTSTTGSSTNSSPANLTVFNGKLYFSATDGTNGVELWMTDGTTAGTVMVKDINATGLNVSSTPANLTVVGNQLFFSANDGVNGIELWVSDGTTAGTALVKDINAGTANASPGSLTASNGKLFFAATTVANGVELWTRDGTAAGTNMVVDLFVGTGSGASVTAGTMARFGTGVVFAGNNGTAAPGTGAELWFSDGTAAGTTLVKDLQSGTGSSSPNNMVVWGSRVVFAATTTAAGSEPWITDGTGPGTFMLGDLAAAGTGSTPSQFTVSGNAVFFGATVAATVGRELFMTDGTTTGTGLVKDINAATANGFATTNAIVAPGVGRKVVLGATDATNGTELFVSDGTLAGTNLVSDLNPGANSSTPTNFLVLGDRLLMSASTGTDKVANPAAVGVELFAVTLDSLAVTEAETFGSSCQGTGTPAIGYSGGAPFLGNATFSVDLSGAKPSAPAALFFNLTRGDLPIGTCTVYPSLVPTVNINTATNVSGAAGIGLPVPPGPWNIGTQLYFQWVVIDLGGPILNVASTSNGLRIRIGGS